MQSDALKQFVIDKIEDLKGRDIITLDLRNKATFADYMVVCSANSSRHALSIAQHVASEARSEGIIPLGVEGADVGEWCLVDLNDVIVHIMTESTRDLYELEKLWGNV